VKQVFSHVRKKEQVDIAKYYLSRVGLADSFDKKARDLSQGMQQRVGIARAFAIKPKILLLDEPFGMLDSLTRQELQNVLLEIWERERITAIQITHDVDEAIFLADRIIMMTSGPGAQIGDILSIDFERPRLRKEIINHPDYYHYRKHLIDFLES
jgi:nitrate/nitrite transport system ATP-binding protein